MAVRLRTFTGLLLLAGILSFLPKQISGNGVGYDDALAKAGGQGNGKGQGAEHASSNGGGSGTNGNSATTSAGLAKGQTYDVNGRMNALVKASSTAWQNPHSQIGKMAQALTTALGSYLTAVSADPAAPLSADLVSILATISNKDLTQEDLDALEARIAQENPENTLFAGLVDPITIDPTTNLVLQTTLQSVDSALITAVNAVEETNQGLGPIY